MALDMFLEIEGDSPDWAMIRLIAEKMDVEWPDTDPGKGPMHGSFPNSWMHFWVGGGGKDRELREPVAEGKHDCHFLTRYTILFRLINSKYDECREDIKKFLTHLSELTSMQFVLSFQFEGVYAIRDHQRGFEWFWDNTR